MAEYALRLESGADTADRMRMADSLALTAGGPLAARSGLRPDGGGEVTVVPGSMSVQVTPFLAWLDGGTSVAQGGYPFVCDTTRTLAVADGDATASRVDTIAAVVRDDAYDGGGATIAELVVVEGTPGAPGAPALPPTAVALRDVFVPAGTSAGTGGLSAALLGSDRRQYLVAAGGVLPVSGAVERDALPLQLGATVYRADTDQLQVRHSEGWVSYQAVEDTGWQTLPLAAGYAAHSTDLTPEYRVVNGVCFTRGLVVRSSGANFVSGDAVVIGTLPIGARPESTEYHALVTNSEGVNGRLVFVNDGRLQVQPGGTVAYVSVAGSYVLN